SRRSRWSGVGGTSLRDIPLPSPWLRSSPAGRWPRTRSSCTGSRSARRRQDDGRLSVRLALAFLVAGIGFLTIAHAAWAHAIGVACFFGFILAGYRGALPPDV